MKWIFIITLLLFTILCEGQSRSIFVKLISEKNNNRAVTLYGNTKNVASMTCLIGTSIFYPIPCDTARGVQIYPDVAKYKDKPYFSFKIAGEYRCGDSIIVNVDTQVVTLVSNHK